MFFKRRKKFDSLYPWGYVFWFILCFYIFFVFEGVDRYREVFKDRELNGIDVYGLIYALLIVCFIFFLFTSIKLRKRERAIVEKYGGNLILELKNRGSDFIFLILNLKFGKIKRYFDSFKIELLVNFIFIIGITFLFRNIESLYFLDKNLFSHYFLTHEKILSGLFLVIVFFYILNFQIVTLMNFLAEIKVERKCFKVFEGDFFKSYKFSHTGFIFLIWCFMIGAQILIVDLKDDLTRLFYLYNLFSLACEGYFLIALFSIYRKYNFLFNKIEEYYEICK